MNHYLPGLSTSGAGYNIWSNFQWSTAGFELSVFFLLDWFRFQSNLLINNKEDIKTFSEIFAVFVQSIMSKKIINDLLVGKKAST